MPSTSLATAADLAARGIVADFAQVDMYLATASTAVRAAAGAHISELTSTIKLSGYAGNPWLKLPGGPVTGVSEVRIDGDVVTDWRLADGRLWRYAGWATFGYGRPSEVQVTYTHGLADVPEDIVDLVCRMVAATKASLDADEEGLGLAIDNGRLQSVTMDGFTESYATSADAVASVTEMILPERTRNWLARRFGGGSSSTVSR